MQLLLVQQESEKNGPGEILIVHFFLTGNFSADFVSAGYVAVNITQGCLLLYFKYVIDKEQIFTVAMLALVVSGALSIPLWKLLIGS